MDPEHASSRDKGIRASAAEEARACTHLTRPKEPEKGEYILTQMTDRALNILRKRHVSLPRPKLMHTTVSLHVRHRTPKGRRLSSPPQRRCSPLSMIPIT